MGFFKEKTAFDVALAKLRPGLQAQRLAAQMPPPKPKRRKKAGCGEGGRPGFVGEIFFFGGEKLAKESSHRFLVSNYYCLDV